MMRAPGTRRRFADLPLAWLMLLVFALLLALFVGLADAVISANPMLAMDQSAASAMVPLRRPRWFHLFFLLTRLGDAELVLPLVGVLGLVLWKWRRGDLMRALWLTCYGAAFTTVVAKLAFARVRPPSPEYPHFTYSFPSGHASTAMAFYGFAGYLALRSAAGLPGRAGAALVAAMLVALVGFSRVQLGVHYLSDVWGGFLIGGLWVVAGIAFSEWSCAKSGQPWTVPMARPPRGQLWALAVGTLLWYAVFIRTGGWLSLRVL
jgi:membrane-associated phospholipid phosphatase